MSTSHRRPLPALAVGLLIAGAMAVTVELAAWGYETLRIPDLASPPEANAGPITMTTHPYLLWEHSPGMRQELGVSVNINSLGLRGPEPRLPKPEGIRRILAVGDSSVYGFRVPFEDCFVQVAAQRLGGPEQGLEGLPAALPGYSTLQLLNLLQLRALRLEPDMIVIAALWSDHSTAGQQDAQLLDRYQRYDRSALGALDRAFHHSAFYRVLSWELGVRRGEQARTRASQNLDPTTTDGTSQRVPIADYRRNLEALVGMARDHNAEVAFLVLPHPLDRTHHGRGQQSFEAYRTALREAAAAHGAPLVRGDQVFEQAVAQDPSLGGGDLFVDRIHPSVLGHRLLGEALGEALSDWEQTTRP